MPVEIHHEGQNPQGPFKEMSRQEHRGKGNFKKNHSNLNKPSKIDRNEFKKQNKNIGRKNMDSKVKQEMDEVIAELKNSHQMYWIGEDPQVLN